MPLVMIQFSYTVIQQVSQEKIVRYAPVSAIREYMDLSASPKLKQSLDIHSLTQIYIFSLSC